MFASYPATSTLNHYISSIVLQARIYFNLKLSKEKQSVEIFTTKDEAERHP